MLKIDLSDDAFVKRLIPPHWAYCFNQSCPMADKCIRQVSTRLIPADLQQGQAIFPSALHDGTCSYLQQATIATLAWGFSKLYDAMPHGEMKEAKRTVMEYLGGKGDYYRYHRGERKLSPQQQDRITQILRKHGATQAVWDHTETTAVLTRNLPSSDGSDNTEPSVQGC